MKTYEYRTSNFDAENSEEQMNILGNLGWEAFYVSKEKEVGYQSGKYYVTVFFKREIKNSEILQVLC